MRFGKVGMLGSSRGIGSRASGLWQERRAPQAAQMPPAREPHKRKLSKKGVCRTNMKEVVQLCMEEQGSSADDLPKFVGLQQVEVGV